MFDAARNRVEQRVDVPRDITHRDDSRINVAFRRHRAQARIDEHSVGDVEARVLQPGRLRIRPDGNHEHIALERDAAGQDHPLDVRVTDDAEQGFAAVEPDSVRFVASEQFGLQNRPKRSLKRHATLSNNGDIGTSVRRCRGNLAANKSGALDDNSRARRQNLAQADGILKRTKNPDPAESMIWDWQRFWAQPGRDHQGVVLVVPTVRIANDSSRAIEGHRRSAEYPVDSVLETRPQGERNMLVPLTMGAQQALE